MFKYSQWLCAIAVMGCSTAFTSCEEKEELGPQLPTEFALVINQINVSWDETEAVVDFDANEKWKVVSTPEWIKVDPKSGKPGTHRMFFNLTANPYRLPRVGEVTVTCGEKTGTITFTQGGCTDEASVATAKFNGEMTTLEGSTYSVSFNEFANEIKGNLGLSLAEFGNGIDADGDLEFFMVSGSEWVKGGTAGTPCGAWLDSELAVTNWSYTGYPANSLFIEAYPGEEPTLAIGHAAGVPDNAEFNLKFGFTFKNDHTRFLIFEGTVKVVPVSLTGPIVATYTLDATVPASDGYQNVYIPFDAADVAAKLGTSNVARCKVVTYDADGEFVKYSANNGYWCKTDGSIGSWGSGAGWAIEYHGDEADTAATTYGSWSICPYPGVSGVSGTTKIGLWYNGKVVMFDINVIIPAAAASENSK